MTSNDPKISQTPENVSIALGGGDAFIGDKVAGQSKSRAPKQPESDGSQDVFGGRVIQGDKVVNAEGTTFVARPSPAQHSPRPQASPSGQASRQDRDNAVKAKVIAAFPDDDLQEDEIILAPDGDIIIDRRKKHPLARPLVVGRWKSEASGTSRGPAPPAAQVAEAQRAIAEAQRHRLAHEAQMAADRRAHDQQVLADLQRRYGAPGGEQATAPAPATATATAAPTVSGDAVSLSSAVAFSTGMAQQADHSASQVELAVAHLAAGGVTGVAITSFTQAQEALGLAAQAFRLAGDALTQHLQVRDAYDANPGAGTREFLTSD